MGKDSELLHAVKVEDVVTVQKITSKLRAKSSKYSDITSSEVVSNTKQIKAFPILS